MNWMLLKPEDVRDDWTFEVRDRRARHIHEILQTSPGDGLRALILNEARFTVRVDQVEPAQVRGKLESQLPTPERPTTELMLAVPRPKVLKRLIPQIAALGVRSLFLFKANKVEKSFLQSPVLDLENIREQLIFGLEQVGDPWMPDVYVLPQFRSLVETHLNRFSAASRRVVLHPGENGVLSEGAPTLLAIGPEGGWIPHELNLLRENGFTTAGLGDRVLRSDTAVITALGKISLP